MESLRRFLRSGTPGQETAGQGGTSRTFFLRSFLGRFLPLAGVGILGGLYTFEVTGWHWESLLFGAGIMGVLAVGAWSWTRTDQAHILAQKRLVHRLALSDEILNSVLDLVLVADETGSVIYASPSVKSMLGYEPEEVLGDGWWNVTRLDPVEREEEKAAARRRARGEVEEGWGQPYDRLLLRRDGTQRWIRWRESPGPGRTIVGIGSDVTDRKRGEEASKRLGALVENTSEFVGYAWPEGTVEFINPGGRKLVGLGEDFDPTSTTMLDFVAPADRDRFHNLVLPPVLAGESWQGELRFVDFAGGETIPVYGSVFPVMDEEGGRPQTVCGSFMDLREQKALELSLVEALHKAEEASKAKQQFLANMSHEIRTPMNAIIGMADLLWESPLSSEHKEYVRVFRRSGETLLDLINDILDLAKVEEGRLDLEEVGFNLPELVEGTVEVFAAQAQKKGLEMGVRISPDVPSWVMGDPGRLRQILSNLLGNAVKFTETGEILARVSAAPQTADESPFSKGGRVSLHFSVRDTGVGIPRDRIQAVFDRFMQVDSTTTRRFGGSGLGLAICRKLVDLMGGTIWVESEEGEGSTFHFTLTLPVTEPSRGEDELDTSALAGLRTLVVDDNATNRLVVREILVSWGVRAVEARDGFSAMEALKEGVAGGNPFRLLIVDGQMPGMDGYALVAGIRGDPTFGRPRIIMLTSYGGELTGLKARELGISAHMMKPVRRASLHHAISRAVGGRRAPAPVAEGAPPTEPVVEGPVGILRILVVDDSDDNRTLMRAYLKMTPHHVEFAENGEEAFQRVQRGPDFDLILMDIQMPVMDGHSATRAIRAWEREQGREPVRIFALSAYAMAEEIRASLEAGCDDHLTKPIKKSVLLETLAGVARAIDDGATSVDQADAWGVDP
jgi:PAS domain S-box-containing protein